MLLGCNDYDIYSSKMLNTGKVVNTVHATFDKEKPSISGGESYSSSEESAFSAGCNSGTERFSSTSRIEDEQNKPDHEAGVSNSTSNDSDDDNSRTVIFDSNVKRNRKAPEFYGFSKIIANKSITTPITTSDEPTVREAILATPPEIELWTEAMREELQNLEEKDTWLQKGVVPRSAPKKFVVPNGESIAPIHFVLKT